MRADLDQGYADTGMVEHSSSGPYGSAYKLQIRAGTMPTIRGSAAQLLATGTHATAVIISAQPMGKTVRDIRASWPLVTTR